MYERYIPPDTVYDPLPWEEDQPPAQPASARPDQGRRPPARPAQAPARPRRGSADPLGGAAQEAGKLLEGIFKNFSLKDLDTGDILLILIVVFLFLERDDDLDLAIALGLMLLLSLGESGGAPEGGGSPPAQEGTV